MVWWDQTTAITAAMIARIPFVRGTHQIDFQVFVRVCDDMIQVYVRTSGPVSADCRSGAGPEGFEIVHAQLSDPGEEEVDDGQLRHSARHCSGPDLGFAGWGDENVIRQLRDGGLGHSRHGDRRGIVGPSHGESLDDFLGATAERDSHGDARLSAQCGMDELDVGVVVMLADQTDAFQLLGEIVGHEPAGTDPEEDGPRRDGDGAGHGFELFRVHRAGGAHTASVCCNHDALISDEVDLPVEIDAGPEVLTGSTRLKAGTAQKLVLNMISTATMVGLGKTYGNLMVDVSPSNEKLRQRAVSIVVSATGCTRDQAVIALHEADGHAKTAIVMILLDMTAAQARERLTTSGGAVRAAVDQDHPHI